MIKPIPLPKAGEGVGQLWKTVALLVHAVNALRKLRIVPSRRSAFGWGQADAVIEYVAGEGGARTPVRLMGQPYNPPYTGEGEIPQDWNLNIMVRAVCVGTPKRVVRPSNPNQVFTVPANCVGGYFIWVRATVDEDGQANSMLLEGGTEFPSTVTVSGDDPDSLPPVTYFPLLVLSSDAHGVILSETVYGSTTALSLFPVVTNLNFGVERRMQWSPVSTINGNTTLV